MGALAQEIAHGTQREIEIGVDQSRTRKGFLASTDLTPDTGEKLDIVFDFVIGGILGGGAHDEAGALGPRCVDEITQALALGITTDALADAHLIDGRHEHAVATRQGEMAGDARALLADRIFDHLHEHFLTGAQQIFDLAIGQLLFAACQSSRGAFGRFVATVIGVGVFEQFFLVA